jgi:hypothetical protein
VLISLQLLTISSSGAIFAAGKVSDAVHQKMSVPSSDVPTESRVKNCLKEKSEFLDQKQIERNMRHSIGKA